MERVWRRYLNYTISDYNLTYVGPSTVLDLIFGHCWAQMAYNLLWLANITVMQSLKGGNFAIETGNH